MIKWLSGWAQGIIISVIIVTIIEIILPNGSIKRYIKVILGIYILFTIIYPIMNKISAKSINVEDFINSANSNAILDENNNKVQKTFESNNSKTVKDIYKENLKKDIENKLSQKGYNTKIENIEISDAEQNYEIKEIKLRVYKIKHQTNNNLTDTNAIKINNIDINIGNSTTDDETVNKTSQIKLTNGEVQEVQEYLEDTYGINKNKIKIE